MRDRRWFVGGTALALLLAPSPAYAHVGHCSNAEAASTIGVSGLVAVLLFRPWRKVSTMTAKITRLALPAVLAFAVTLTGCGGSSSSSSGKVHPGSPVRVQITQPTSNEVTGRDVTLVVNLIGGKVLPLQQSTGAVNPTEGHIHVSLDGRLVNMAYTTTQQLDPNLLTPGQHTVTAEFVAVDHLPFKNPPRAAVIFMVQGQ